MVDVVSRGYWIYLEFLLLAWCGAILTIPMGVAAQNGEGSAIILGEDDFVSRELPTSSKDDYRIGLEDVLAISVWRNPALSQEVAVRPDGKIGLKLVGEVMARGQTLAALTRSLTARYHTYVPEAEVSVTLKEINSFKVYVLGNVEHPGEIKVQSGLTVLQALALSGGFTPYADVKKIKVFRAAEGGDTLLEFNYKRVVKGDGAGDLTLLPGDRLVVP